MSRDTRPTEGGGVGGDRGSGFGGRSTVWRSGFRDGISRRAQIIPAIAEAATTSQNVGCRSMSDLPRLPGVDVVGDVAPNHLCRDSAGERVSPPLTTDRHNGTWVVHCRSMP